jgi:multidrug efflux system membrane fusion protein
MASRLKFKFVVLTVAIAAAGAAWHWQHEPHIAAVISGLTGHSDQPRQASQGGRRGGSSDPSQPVPVTATTAQMQDVPIFINGLGAVQGFNTVTIKPRVDGQLIKVLFTEGQDVKQGDELAEIDPRPLQAQLAQARATKSKDEAQLANAKRDLERFAALKEYASKQSVDAQGTQVQQLTAAIEGDQAAIDNATVQLGYTTITAPISGRTGIRLVDVGNIVHANDPGGLVVITQVQPISVIFTLPQDALIDVMTSMNQGSPLKVLAFKRDDSKQLGEGELSLVDNQIDQNTGTIRLKATFPNADDQLWPGEFVSAHLLLAIRQNAVTVPAQVVQRGPNGMLVYVIKPDQTVEARQVKVGPSYNDIVIITEGLSAGEQVILDGQLKVQPGSHVDIRTAEKKPVANDG